MYVCNMPIPLLAKNIICIFIITFIIIFMIFIPSIYAKDLARKFCISEYTKSKCLCGRYIL